MDDKEWMSVEGFVYEAAMDRTELIARRLATTGLDSLEIETHPDYVAAWEAETVIYKVWRDKLEELLGRKVGA